MIESTRVVSSRLPTIVSLLWREGESQSRLTIAKRGDRRGEVGHEGRSMDRMYGIDEKDGAHEKDHPPRIAIA